jgi:hypothetical protein
MELAHQEPLDLTTGEEGEMRFRNNLASLSGVGLVTNQYLNSATTIRKRCQETYGPSSNRQKVSLLHSSNSDHSHLLTHLFQTGDKLSIDDLRARKTYIRKASEATKLPANRSTSNQVSRNWLLVTPISQNKEVANVQALLDQS